LTIKDVKCEWSKECEVSFQDLKRRLTTFPILTLPLGTKGFVVYNDVSKTGLDCVLMQHMKVIDYALRKMKPYEVTIMFMIWSWLL
jgi:hypothetical protein